MASGSLTTNNRPQKKRRTTNNSSNTSSSQAATALAGKVRNSCQLESGRRGRGGNAKAGCVCGTCVTAVASLSTSMRDGLARLDGHSDPALRMQVGPGDRLDRAARHQTKAEALRQHGDRDDDLDERQRGADADMRTDRKGQIGVARARGGCAASQHLIADLRVVESCIRLAVARIGDTPEEIARAGVVRLAARGNQPID